MKFKTITAKNFLSIGNVTQAVNLDKDFLSLVLGENIDQGGNDTGSRNGTGKTTILNAISYALFDQALTKIKKDNLINKINGKNMIVTLTFEKNGKEYRIERGRKPAVVKFFVDNKEQGKDKASESQGESSNTQKDIEDLLGMSHTMFKHIVALNTYTEPFLSMQAGDQREIVEQLLGITQLSEKAEVLRAQIKETKDKIFVETTTIESIKKSNEKIQQSIANLELKQAAWVQQNQATCEKIKKNISELKQVDIEFEIEQHKKLKEFTEKSAKIKSLNKEKSTLETALIQAQRAVVKYAKEIDQLKDNKCPACEQNLLSHKHDEMHTIASKNLSDAEEYLQKLKKDIEAINTEIKNLGDDLTAPSTFYENIEDALQHQNNLNTLEQVLIEKLKESNPYLEQINELKDSALQEISWDAVNNLTLLKDHQEFLLKLLTNKDSFIRKKIIDQNLSYLNSRLSHYLDHMGLPHRVVFQNDLSVEITQMGQDLDFDNLSRGERNRLILSLSWAFRDVWENLYQSINLLFIDELIDNGLDANGVENALKILKQISRERNKNIFLISHRDELVGRVNSVLRVTKENNFTTYSSDIEYYTET